MAPTHLEFVENESLRLTSIGSPSQEPLFATATTINEAELWTEIRERDWRDRITTVRIAPELIDHPTPASAGILRIIEELPNLRAASMWAVSSSTDTLSAIGELDQLCQRRGLPLICDILLDAGASSVKSHCDWPNSLSEILKASQILRRKGINVRWVIPLCPTFVYRLEGIFSLARAEPCDAVLTPIGFPYFKQLRPCRELNPAETLFAWDFISYRLLMEERSLLTQEALEFYQSLQRTLANGQPLPPRIPTNAAVLAVDMDMSQAQRPWRILEMPVQALHLGTLSPKESRLRIRRIVGDVMTGKLDVAHVLRDGLRAVGQRGAAWIGHSSTRRDVPKAGNELTSVAIIGAYGGEHIGDTAILGGVLTRFHRSHGVKRTVLMSQRPAHSLHLVNMLEVPVDVSVELYEHTAIRECLKQVDAVVFAGGPLMDMPKQLVRHLYSAALATRMHKPFFIEGVGCGPFVRHSSQWVARRLVRMAKHVSVRTSDDGMHPVMRGREVRVDRDPAFDYLESRGSVLTRMTDLDRSWLDRLLQDVEGRTVVGINIRPIRHEYTTTAGRQGCPKYTRHVESRFEQSLAEAMRLYSRHAATEPRFIFFPMNAIQFGLSDLRSAYRIKRLVDQDVDFQIWESDASLDAIVALMRRLDAVIAMRFHAAIFALSQRRPVIGIDYRVGKRDKVAALLSDFGQSKNCARIDEVSAEWLCECLTDLCQPSKVAANAGSMAGAALGEERTSMRRFDVSKLLF